MELMLVVIDIYYVSMSSPIHAKTIFSYLACGIKLGLRNLFGLKSEFIEGKLSVHKISGTVQKVKFWIFVLSTVEYLKQF